MKFKKLKQLLSNYDSGKSSAAERRVVDIWYASFSKKKLEVPLLNDEQQKEALRKRIWEQLPLNKIEITFFQRHKAWFYTLGAAALLLLVGVWSYRQHDLAPSADTNQMIQSVVFRSQTGDRERKLFTLPDSSQVWLNANSSVEVAANYGSGARQVYLQGEAFFDVKPNSQSPFVVETAHLQIEVLGTAFNVSTYQHLSRAHVTVDHGTVAVRDSSKKLLEKLTQGQSLSYTIADKQFTVGRSLSAGSWREGRTILEQATFDELAQTLFNLYGVRLQSETSGPKSYSYNLQMHADRSLEQTMTIISRMHRLKYRRKNNEIILY